MQGTASRLVWCSDNSHLARTPRFCRVARWQSSRVANLLAITLLVLDRKWHVAMLL